MHSLFTVAKNEFYRYFISPLAYVYLISFLLLNGSFALYFGHWFDRGQADLLPMFGFQPWLYLLFIPGISMRLWSEEFRNKTILQIITMPVSISALVWGKFLASWLFCAFALFLTFPFWLTVNLLGSPDNAVIAVGYGGSFLLAGCMLAISQTMSALTKNQVIALVLSVVANLVFFLSGIEYILGIFRTFAPLPIVDMVASFSFLTHFDTISRGLVELRDLVFFASLILLFNFTTVLIISFKTAGTTPWLKSGRRGYYISVFIFLLIGFTGLNLIANNLLRRWQADFTEEKLFTLTDSTRKILSGLPEPVVAKLYYSPILGRRSPEMRRLFDQVRLTLQQYAKLSNGRFSYQIYNPVPLSDIEDRALAAGIQPLPVIDTSTNAYFGLTFTDELENRSVIPYFPLERSDFIEQDLTEAVYLLNRPRKKLGIITSLPMYEDVIENVATPKWEILNQLGKFYKITSIDDTNLSGLAEQDALLIAHPLSLSPELEQAVLNFSLRGGKIFLALDPAAEAPRLFSPVTQELKPSDLGSLTAAWGFRFGADAVVADLANSSTIDATVDYKSNPEFTQDLIQFYLQDGSFNPDFKTTSRLKKMMVTSATVIEPLPDAPVYFLPLLSPSGESELLPAEVVYRGIHPAEILRRFTPDGRTKHIAAHIISKDAARPFELIVIGDSDFLYDNFWTVHQTILERNYAIPVLDNANFVLNALDTLMGNQDLISLRGKSARNRAFGQIEAERRNAQKEFKIKEKDIFDQIEKTKTALQEIWNKKNFEGRETFTADELALIAGIRKTIDRQRQELFTIRANINHNIDHQENWVKFVNIYALPLLILLGMLVFLFAAAPRSQTAVKFTVNRPLFFIAAVSLLLLLLGFAAVSYNNHLAVSDYEGRPLFASLPARINEVTSITLQNHNQTLQFYRDGSEWKLQGYPHRPVYQQRIRSFLSALMEAAYYEKKTADMNKLARFGLTPVETEGSDATRIELRTASGKLLTGFDIGRYDLDLGRGSKGAYIKLDNQFQVWLANIDLIDLSLNPAEWTFSTAWNLRFGRLKSANGITDSDRLANLAKILLNTFFTGSTEKQPFALPAQNLKAKDEELKLSLTRQPHNLKVINEQDEAVEITLWQDGSRWFISYKFLTPLVTPDLQSFAAYATSVFYEITAADGEKISHAIPERNTD